jgi:hypothetical protein
MLKGKADAGKSNCADMLVRAWELLPCVYLRWMNDLAASAGFFGKHKANQDVAATEIHHEKNVVWVRGPPLNESRWN